MNVAGFTCSLKALLIFLTNSFIQYPKNAFKSNIDFAETISKVYLQIWTLLEPSLWFFAVLQCIKICSLSSKWFVNFFPTKKFVYSLDIESTECQNNKKLVIVVEIKMFPQILSKF